MRSYRVARFVPQPAQMLGLTLAGILLLSALLYYKAVKAQRYLEPSLAIAQPRIEFAQKLNQLVESEFGSKSVKGIVLASNSIFVDDSLLFTDPIQRRVTDPIVITRLGRIFLSMLKDPQMKPQFDFIMIATTQPISPHPQMNRLKKREMQHIAERILDALYGVEPELSEHYRRYFVATALANEMTKSDRWVEFKIIPSEHLHIEMIKGLGKYYF